MPNWLSMLHAGLADGLLYALIVATTALAAVFAPTRVRRRAAQEVLRILLFRDKKNF
jgi:hypothetical protein